VDYSKKNIINLLKKNAFSEAIILIEEEIKEHPDDLEWAISLSIGLSRIGKRDQSVDVLLRILERDPENANSLLNIAWEEFHLGRKVAAINHSTRLLFLASCKNLNTKIVSQGHNNLGYFYEDMTYFERAVYHYSEALRINPTNSHAFHNLNVIKEMADINHGIIRVVTDPEGNTYPNIWIYNEGCTQMESQQIFLNAELIEERRCVPEGQLVEAVAIPWLCILRELQLNPYFLYQIPWRKLEELIAATYYKFGWDEVILTPGSGDKGRDIIASKNGFGAVRIFDQVKAYAPNRKVTADDVRALLGVLTLDGNVSKGVLTTTADFAPGVANEFAKVIPYRIELRNGEKLREWLLNANRKYETPIIGSEFL
jgi:restriction system protein